MGISKLSCVYDYQKQVFTLETSGGQNTMFMQKQLCLKGGFLRALTRVCASDTLEPLLCSFLGHVFHGTKKLVMLLVNNGLINGLTISRIYLIYLQLFKNDC